MTAQVYRLALAVLLTALLTACDAAPAPETRVTPTPLPPPPTWEEPAGAITLANVQEIEPLGLLALPEPPSTVFAHALSPDQTLLAGLNRDWLLVWDLVSGDLLFNAPSRAANRVYFSPDKDDVYTVNSQGVVEIINATNGNLREAFAAFPNYANVAAYDPERGLLALGATDGALKVWDLPARQSLLTQPTGLDGEITALAFPPDGRTLAVGADNGRVAVWDVEARAMARGFETGARVGALLYAPDGARLVTASPVSAQIWDAAGGQQTGVLETNGIGDVLAFVPDSPYLVSSGAEEGATSVLIWNIETGATQASLAREGADRLSAAFSPDGQLLLLAELGVGGRLWSLEGLADGAVGRGGLIIDDTTLFSAVWTGDSFALLAFDTTGPIRAWGLRSG
jgi:WD40 repeat protein